jgi:hypothetical protein
MKNKVPLGESEVLSRRNFARKTIGIAAIALLPIADPTTGEALQSSAVNLPDKPQDLSDADWGEVQARYSNLLRVYGARLSQEEKRRLVNILTTNQHMLASIRKFIVQNGDPSACTLRV